MLLLFVAAVSKLHGRSEPITKAPVKLSNDVNGARTREIRCSRNALTQPDWQFGLTLCGCANATAIVAVLSKSDAQYPRDTIKPAVLSVQASVAESHDHGP